MCFDHELDVVSNWWLTSPTFGFHSRTVQLQYMYTSNTYTPSTYIIYHIPEIDRIYLQPERAYLVRRPYTGVHCEEDYCRGCLSAPKTGKIEWLVKLKEVQIEMPR